METKKYQPMTHKFNAFMLETSYTALTKDNVGTALDHTNTVN